MKEIKKILIVRFSSIGDIVLTSPIIRCVQTKFPNAEIHFLTKEIFLPIVQNNPYLDKCWGIKHSNKEIILDLKNEQFDVLIDLHKNIRTVRLKNELKVPVYSFDKLNVKKWLLTSFKVNFLPKIHIVDRYFNGIKALGITNDLKGLDFFIAPEDQVNLSAVLPELKTPFAVLVCGAAHETKNLSLNKSIELMSAFDFPIVLIGGKSEITRGELIVAGIKNSKQNIYNLCGKLNLAQSASVIQQSQVIITPDTGMMHIAAALNKNIISVWGNTVPEFGMYPYLPGKENQFKIAEVKGLSCRPCSKIGYETCPKKHFKCINNLDVNQIKIWAETFFKKEI